jgi:hypothetical protein
MEKFNFDFSKPEDQEKFDRLSKPVKKKLINKSHEEALLENKKVDEEIKTKANLKDKKTEIDIDRGWREQLSDKQVENIKIWVERLVKGWHDNIQPDYVFLTETKAVPYGWVIKECWKNAYPNEKLPKFYRIIPKWNSFISNTGLAFIPKNVNLQQDKSYSRKLSPEEQKDLQIVNSFINKRVQTDQPKIIVFDEGWAEGTSDDGSERMGLIHQLIPGERITRPGSGSMQSAMNVFYNVLRDKNPIIYGSQQVTGDVLYGVEKVSEIGKDYSRYVYKPEYKPNINKSRMPTSKMVRSGDYQNDQSPIRHRTEDDMRFFSKVTTRDGYPSGYNTTMTGAIVKHPGQRKRAIGYVNDLKEIGKEAGKKLLNDLENNNFQSK